MAGCDYSCLLNGGDPMGMTNEQYKGMLLDQLDDWKRVLEMAKIAKVSNIQEEIEKQIAKINEKLKF